MSKMNLRKKRKAVCDDDFKQQVVNEVLNEDISHTQVARDYGVRSNFISRWIRKFKNSKQAISQVQPNQDIDAVNSALLKEIRQLKIDNEILKKAATYWARNQD